MVPACLRGLANGRGGVRYRLDGGFPRRGCVLGRGARTHLTSFSFRAFRFATRCPGICRGRCPHRPAAEAFINHRPAAAKISASWTYPRALPRAEPYGVRRRAGWENGRHKRALRPRGTTETLAAPISCGRGSACRKRAILCAKCAKLPFCAPERSAEGNRKASAQHKASGVSQRLTALPAASAALRVKILFAIIGTFITRPVKE